MNKKNKKIVASLALLAAVLAMIIICLWPTKYYLESPGAALPTKALVKTKEKRPASQLYLVTVAVSRQPVSVAEYLWSFSQSYTDRVPQEELLGQETSSQYEESQNWYMATSQQMAIYNAARYAQKPAKLQYRGVYVMGIQPNSSFKHKLHLGDTIIAVDGHHFKSTMGLMHYVAKHRQGQALTITVLRNGHQYHYCGHAVAVKGTKRAGIGIQLVERTKVVTKPAIKIAAGDIGGPSAGLMFSLECYQIFTKHSLAPGHRIAGTGTIAANGKVGIIGGVDKKVVAADHAGCEVFFAPTDRSGGVKKSATNYAEAKRTVRHLHSKMKVVPVAKFTDALNYLKKHY